MPEPILIAAKSRPVVVLDGRHWSSRRLVTLGAMTVMAVAMAVLMTKAWIVSFYVVPSASMEPTVRSGERVVVDKWSYRFRSPERGEVVVFDGSGLFDDPEPGEHQFVKRIIGIAGDHIRCCDAGGQLSVNGAVLDETAYLEPSVEPSKVRFDVIVPPGALWVMGDNRLRSADSRRYIGRAFGGFVPADRVQGRAIVATKVDSQ